MSTRKREIARLFAGVGTVATVLHWALGSSDVLRLPLALLDSTIRRETNVAAMVSRRLFFDYGWLKPGAGGSSMKAKIMLLMVVLLMPGCGAPGVSTEVRIQVKKTDSASVRVNTAALESDEANMFVEGVLSKSARADSTASAHLDIVAYDAHGVRVAEQFTAFIPGEIPGRLRGVGGRTRYRVLLNFPLVNVAQIEVRAHEGSHAGP